MSSSDGESYRVKDLFDSSSMFLKDLFRGQKGIFPEEKFVAEHRFKQTFLQYLKIRNENDIDPDHLVIIARNIHEPHNGISEEKRYRKVDIFEYRFGHMYIFGILFLPIRVDDVLKMFQDNMVCWWVVPLII
jgi:hypothetical protein